jgi:hypothetical protein
VVEFDHDHFLQDRLQSYHSVLHSLRTDTAHTSLPRRKVTCEVQFALHWTQVLLLSPTADITPPHYNIIMYITPRSALRQVQTK